MKIVSQWPKKPVYWTEEGCPDTLYISVPFTWDMPGVRTRLVDMFPDHPDSTPVQHVVLGGPGCYLALHYYPGLLKDISADIEVRSSYPGVLQRVNPMATRTTTGCPRHCLFCGVGQGIIEPGPFQLLDDWPNLPEFCDNNILYAPEEHFDRVIDQVKEKYNWCDFNQGVDPRLLTEHHAQRLAELPESIIRLALDHDSVRPDWERAFAFLRAAGIQKRRIRSYVLVGFKSDPVDAWSRCRWVESHGVKALPMWYHSLDILEKNTVTSEQMSFGWTDYERRSLFQFYYQHKLAVKRGD